ncbi:DUF2726 domain-containing protein [Candidatus Venteria ishoeyi]|nr:DUF2726 domain-containing protein [Candidatus Venteria ishoeyi]MDM8545772.1 DUF2726 domain-containing protein [Candidatus Venteria ishoeyi]
MEKINIGWWVLAFAILLLYALLRNRQKPKPTDYPYIAQPALFTPAEKRFYMILDKVLERRYLIFGKVRLADIIKVQNNLERGVYQGAFNRIAAKHLDYVICRAEDLTVLGVIELDDRSHNLPHRKARDIFVDNALAAAGVPILHVKVQRYYQMGAVQQAIKDTFHI